MNETNSQPASATVNKDSIQTCWRCGSRELQIGSRTLLMGVINVTPDSFSDGGLNFNRDKAIAHARRLRDEGADILDIGGESSRPGAEPVPESEELGRVLPVIEALQDLDIPISIDTYKAGVADAACRAGASIVNDITALAGDPDMARITAQHGAGLVLMHMRGTPASMQSMTQYQNLIEEIKAFLAEAVERAVRAGVRRESIAIDPGIGFGKTGEQNIEILSRIGCFRELGCPVLVGTSRKSFLGHITGQPVDRRIFATAASVACAVSRGADIVRIHDVSAMRDVVRVADAIGRPPGA